MLESAERERLAEKLQYQDSKRRGILVNKKQQQDSQSRMHNNSSQVDTSVGTMPNDYLNYGNVMWPRYEEELNRDLAEDKSASVYLHKRKHKAKPETRSNTRRSLATVRIHDPSLTRSMEPPPE